MRSGKLIVRDMVIQIQIIILEINYQERKKLKERRENLNNDLIIYVFYFFELFKVEENKILFIFS